MAMRRWSAMTPTIQEDDSDTEAPGGGQGVQSLENPLWNGGNSLRMSLLRKSEGSARDADLSVHGDNMTMVYGGRNPGFEGRTMRKARRAERDEREHDENDDEGQGSYSDGFQNPLFGARKQPCQPQSQVVHLEWSSNDSNSSGTFENPLARRRVPKQACEGEQGHVEGEEVPQVVAQAVPSPRSGGHRSRKHVSRLSDDMGPPVATPVAEVGHGHRRNTQKSWWNQLFCAPQCGDGAWYMPDEDVDKGVHK
jgi:hypothetical protein